MKMSKLLVLSSNKGARMKSKRLGRGNASGKGTYAGRGMNGQNSRTGGGVRPGFEGGQTPLYRKMPKLRGFKNPNRTDYQIINIGNLDAFDENEEVDIVKLYEKNLIRNKVNPVKLLGDGEIAKKLTIKVDSVSKSAKEKIEKAKGKIIQLNLEQKPAKKEEKEAKNIETKESK